MNRVGLFTFMAAGALATAGSLAAASAPASLDGTAWVLSTLGKGTVPPVQAPTARFEAGQLSGTDGCNRYSMPYTIRGTTITVGARGATTQMACEPDVMRRAEAFLAALGAAQTFRIKDGSLQLLGADARVLAGFAAQSQKLAGTSWEATGINNGRQAVVSLVKDTKVTMDFGDGVVSGLAGCNQFNASFTAQGKSLRFGPVAATRRACAAPGAMEQEQAFFKALESVATMQIEADRLVLRAADGAMAVTLNRATR